MIVQGYGFTIEKEYASGYYPVSGFFERILTTIDKRNSVNIFLKLSK